MALFAGVWQRTGWRLREGIETDLLAALHAPYHANLSAYSDPDFALVARSLNEPTIVSHSGVIAAMGGRVDGGLSAEDVLRAYMDPAGRLRGISGDYAIAVFDRSHHTLALLCDPVGTQPIYYHEAEDGTFSFGSQIKTVLAAALVAPQPNRAALAQLLVANAGVPRGQTCFAGIYSVPPGHALLVTPDTTSMTAHDDLRPIVPTPLRNFDESCAAFKRRFMQSVERRLSPKGPTSIFLSGGVDSSSIVATAASVASPDQIHAITYGTADGGAADERRFVEHVVRTSRVRCEQMPLAPLNFLAGAKTDAWVSELPVVDDVPGPLTRASEAVRRAGAQHAMMGIWGDQVLFPFPPPLLTEQLRAGKLREFRNTLSSIESWMSDVEVSLVKSLVTKHALRTVVSPHLLDRVKPLKGDELFTGLAPVATMRRPPALQHGAAVRREITRDHTVGINQALTKWGWGGGFEVQLPFADADLLQLLFAIPAEHTLHEGVPKALLRSAMNDLVPDPVRYRKDKGDYSAPILEEMRATRQDCVESLDGGRRLVQYGLLDEKKASDTLARLKGGSEIADADCQKLGKLVGADAWLAVFFESGARYD